MQFQVPQYIEAEDKIVGPFSLRQFLYIGSAGAISLILFYTVQTWLAVMLAMILVALALALAFAKVNGRPLAPTILAAISFYWKPQRYAWHAPKAPVATVRTGTVGFSETRSAREEVNTGSALKDIWQKLQVGGTQGKSKIREIGGRYEVFRGQTGERRVARRVDYR